jgi:hypothetical protein
MGKKSAPKAPDMMPLAEQQAASSKENTEYQTHANRADQVTPFGTQTWTNESIIDPVTGNKVPKWTQTTTLDPNAQRAYDATSGLEAGRAELAGSMLGRIQEEYGPTINYDDFAAKGKGVKATGKIRGKLGGADDYYGRAGDALMAQFSDRMNPKFEQDTERFDAVLRARGLKPGEESYNSALADMRQSQGDQFNSAMYQAQQLSAQEAQRLQGMDKTQLDVFNNAIKDQLGIDLDLSKFADYQRQRDVTEEQQKRGWSLNEANAIGAGTQVGMPTMPTYNTAGRAETTQYMNAGQANFDNQMAQQSMDNASTMGMISAISAPFSMAIPS